jgi:hypothetical protein
VQHEATIYTHLAKSFQFLPMAHNNQKHHSENSLEKNILLPQNEKDVLGVDEDFATILFHSSIDFQQLCGCNKTDGRADHK